MSYVVIAEWVAQPGNEDEVESILTEIGVAARAEPACRIFRLHRDPDNAQRFVLYEEYDDEDGFTAHTETDHFKRLVLERGVPLLASRERSFLQLVDEG
jgi:quinol monooxygenase YgiN